MEGTVYKEIESGPILRGDLAIIGETARLYRKQRAAGARAEGRSSSARQVSTLTYGESIEGERDGWLGTDGVILRPFPAVNCASWEVVAPDDLYLDTDGIWYASVEGTPANGSVRPVLRGRTNRECVPVRSDHRAGRIYIPDVPAGWVEDLTADRERLRAELKEVELRLTALADYKRNQD